MLNFKLQTYCFRFKVYDLGLTGFRILGIVFEFKILGFKIGFNNILKFLKFWDLYGLNSKFMEERMMLMIMWMSNLYPCVNTSQVAIFNWRGINFDMRSPFQTILHSNYTHHILQKYILDLDNRL